MNPSDMDQQRAIPLAGICLKLLFLVIKKRISRAAVHVITLKT